jgi:hypothetical protein
MSIEMVTNDAVVGLLTSSRHIESSTFFHGLYLREDGGLNDGSTAPHQSKGFNNCEVTRRLCCRAKVHMGVAYSGC